MAIPAQMRNAGTMSTTMAFIVRAWRTNSGRGDPLVQQTKRVEPEVILKTTAITTARITLHMKLRRSYLRCISTAAPVPLR